MKMKSWPVEGLGTASMVLWVNEIRSEELYKGLVDKNCRGMMCTILLKLKSHKTKYRGGGGRGRVQVLGLSVEFGL